MEININPKFPLFIFLSIICLALVNAFSPADHYLLDCGSTELTTVENRQFAGDSSYSGSKLFTSTKTVSVRDHKPDLNISPIYHTARVFTRHSKYVFDVKEKGTYLIRLHFHRLETSSARFHVLINNHVVLYNYTGENTQSPIIYDYMIWVDVGKVAIGFMPLDSSKTAFVSAIELISAPNDLIANNAQFVSFDKNEKVSGLKRIYLQTVHRINVGGPKVTPFNDSLWRTWLPDDEFVKSSQESSTVYFGGQIHYQLGGPSREVGPDNMYNTARVIRSSNNSIPNLKLTWIFPVEEGYKYLVRLHFCDIASIALGELYFNVYINGNLAQENLDLSSLTIRLGSPYYADFVVDECHLAVLKIEVGPSNTSMAHSVDAILNGIEIMKMSDSYGNLDGRDIALTGIYSESASSLSILVPFIATMSLLITLYMAILKKLIGLKESSSICWLPIPPDGYEVELKNGDRLVLNKV